MQSFVDTVRTANLNVVGAALDPTQRDVCAAMAHRLRVWHKDLRKIDEDDVLLELADRFDTLAMPIVVLRPST